MSSSKRKREKKVSLGIHGGGGKGRPLTPIEKVNLVGGGLFRSMRPIGARPPRPEERVS